MRITTSLNELSQTGGFHGILMQEASADINLRFMTDIAGRGSQKAISVTN